jgi:aryl-alcohol dehydrogenase-like predicted oxidoreductase
MEFRNFGQTDLASSVIGFGSWPIGGMRYGRTDDDDALRAIRAALKYDITCFDTAPSYGNGHAEELLGDALKGVRDGVVIVTKGGLIWEDNGNVIGRSSRAEHLNRQINDSLRRLQTDYVDLYLIHWPDLDCPFDEAMEALAGLVRSGKTRYIGVSNFNQNQLKSCSGALQDYRLAANQVSFSLFDRRWERDAFATCSDLGIGIMAYGPLAHGLLTGAITEDVVFDETDWRSSGKLFGQELLTPENLKANLKVVGQLSSVAARNGITLPQLAIAWVLGNPCVTTALVGARNEHEISQAASAAEETLSQDDIAEIESIIEGAAGTSTVLPQ